MILDRARGAVDERNRIPEITEGTAAKLNRFCGSPFYIKAKVVL